MSSFVELLMNRQLSVVPDLVSLFARLLIDDVWSDSCDIPPCVKAGDGQIWVISAFRFQFYIFMCPLRRVNEVLSLDCIYNGAGCPVDLVAMSISCYRNPCYKSRQYHIVSVKWKSNRLEN